MCECGGCECVNVSVEGVSVEGVNVSVEGVRGVHGVWANVRGRM